MLEIIMLIIVIITLLLLIIVINNNKFQFSIIKIDKAEEDISIYLDKKKELLNRARPIILKELKLDTFLENLDDNLDEMNNFQEYELLKNDYNKFFKTLDENEKLLKSENLLSILEDLNDNEEDIVGAIKFYNDTVVEFNKLLVSFPSNIIGFFKRYKRKDFKKKKKREIFEILNDR